MISFYEMIEKTIKTRWGIIVLISVLLLIITLNFKAGYLVLGNDNFSPELNPTLSLERNIFSPAWRTHRVLGLPSDSEQSDLFRTGIFWLFEKILPVWVVSQGYLFLTFFIANFSMASLTAIFCRRLFDKSNEQLAFLLGGLFYLSSMLTVWIYFFPTHLFVAAYAFLPFVLWRLACFFERRTGKNILLLLFASLFFSTAAITATIFLVCSLVVIVFSLILCFEKTAPFNVKHRLIAVFLGLFIVLGIQAYWFLPFITYVKTNTQALQNSAINREITTTTIATEAKYNTILNVFRYYNSWMETKEDSQNYTFGYHDWYKKSQEAGFLSFMPLFFAVIASLYLFKKQRKNLLLLPAMVIVGAFLIKGVNPPFGFINEFFQENLPIFTQVFRWQSSKLWPLLAGSIPILASIGVILVFQFFEKIGQRRISWFFMLAIIVSLLFFVHPFFKGDLVRKKVFVNVPEEYFSLAKYLEKTDRFSRIYLSPEANTLYFRNYSWGFWGSVFLNYVLPNPIIEKALIIGSDQNEQAFTVLTNSYYSENQKAFSQALFLYKTPLVLVDKYAFRGNVGYPYDWKTEQKMVEENPDLEKIWQQEQLTLYRVKNDNDSGQKPINVSAETNLTTLNTVASLDGIIPYYLDSEKPGLIYPFALNFQDISYHDNEIIATMTYTGKSASYNLVIDKNQLEEMPTIMSFDFNNSLLAFSPALPFLQVNSINYNYWLPKKQFRLQNPSVFISLDNLVVDQRGKTNFSKGLETKYSVIDDGALLKSWTGIFTPIDLLSNSNNHQFFCDGKRVLKGEDLRIKNKIKCESPDLTIDKDSVMEIESNIQSDNSILGTICVHSRTRQICLNKNASFLKSGSIKFKTLIPRVLDKGEKIKFYFDFETNEKNGTDIKIINLSLNLYQTKEDLEQKKEEGLISKQDLRVFLNPGDTISLHIPILQGENSFPLRSEDVLIPQVSTTFFDEGLPTKSIISISRQEGLELINQEGNSSVYPRLSFLDPRGSLAMVGLQAENRSGIPLDISIRELNRQFKIWQRKIDSKETTKTLDIFQMPEKIESYSLDLFSTGIGPKESRNSIQALIFQIIPKTWATLKLTPFENTSLVINSLKKANIIENNTYEGEIQKGGTIVTINDSFSPNWRLTIDGETQTKAVIVNGWQQGWLVGKIGKAKVIFWPNKLVYLGFLPLAGVILWLVVKALAKLFAIKVFRNGKLQTKPS